MKVSAMPGKVSLILLGNPRSQKNPSPISAPSRWPLPPSTSRSQPSPREDVMKIAARISGGTYSNKILEEAFVRFKGEEHPHPRQGPGGLHHPRDEGNRKGDRRVGTAKQGDHATPVLAPEVIERRTREFYDNLTGDQKKALEHIPHLPGPGDRHPG